MAGSVQGSFNYVGPMNEEPLYFKHQPHRTNINYDSRVMEVHDIRAFDRPPTLAREGFALARLRLDIGSERDPGAIDEVYHPAFHQLISELTGARKVVVKRSMLRSSERAAQDARLDGVPARYVHCDFDAASFHAMAQAVLADDPLKERWLSGRYAVVQGWRALSPPPQDTPLAVLDRQTLSREDLVHTGNIQGYEGAESRSDNYIYRYNPAHRWAYVSDMTEEDLLLFVGFDSADEGMAGTPHSSFDYWRSCDHTVPRASCETRAFVYWG
ncbi:CmcJ/NvfI family oxidoreductase [Sphingobium tyrosinilyticum]|uniref:CmcJ/NvfI family oxidoreductase n=1 Tax=Sphingobium tyrosinilyticum TaxID=2715436 RepID=A0ABV9F6H4_9SPHN